LHLLETKNTSNALSSYGKILIFGDSFSSFEMLKYVIVQRIDYRLEGWGLFPGMSDRFSSSPQRIDRLWGPPTFLCNG
jgi:hypothetical protein